MFAFFNFNDVFVQQGAAVQLYGVGELQCFLESEEEPEGKIEQYSS